MAINDLYIQKLTSFLDEARRAASKAIDERTDKYQKLERIIKKDKRHKLKRKIQQGVFEDITDVLDKQRLDELRPEIIAWSRATESELYKFRMRREDQVAQVRGKRFTTDAVERKLSLRFKTFKDAQPEVYTPRDVNVHRHIRDDELIDIIQENPEAYLPKKILEDEERMQNYRITYSINKSLFSTKNSDTPYLELWTRTNTNSQRKLNKLTAYILGMRHDIPNDFAGSKQIVREAQEMYQVRDELKRLAPHGLFFDYKGRDTDGRELPEEYDKQYMDALLKRASYLDARYTLERERQGDTDVPHEHKDQMLFGIWADFKHNGYPMESQILMRSVHERMEHGILSHSDTYETEREQRFLKKAEERGVDLVVPHIKELLEYGFRLAPHEN